MSFFQTTVTKKYANTLDKDVLKKAYTNFKAHFHNSGIQENIRNSKEEQYQEGFFRDLFVNILGYKLNPEPNFNLITENNNVTGSKKSDGAIIINGAVCAVIELKGTDTTDLSKIEVQAFGYKNNQVNCSYVITSNFEKLWFYIDNAIDHLAFNLFTLSEAEFELLYLCLSFESIKGNIPQKIKSESLSQEDIITKKLYKDYSLFKRELHQNLVELNPEYDALTLFKKSQKLLDRFLFLFFAEDRNLLPPNSVRLVLNDWRDLQERDEYTPLYSRFKKYFGYLNTGFKGKRYDVFAYNGGLFRPDDLLDAITIDDDLLFKHTQKLSEYDFASEVDVNILGHIFENSLNELDELTNEAMGLNPLSKTQTKRKKDGVFYTPKYITKYIVENTVGKLCMDKKAELLLNEADYFYNKKRTKEVKAELNDKLKTYQNWLLQLTICDPACGSGAFLNQALDFLINEHKYLDELQAKLFGDSMILNDVSKSILENNLFGVDLNEESVEIAKLSLWLHTAQPNRKLNDLNNNIKCGNSLIDDPEIAGDKAFNWQKEFPKVFQKKNKKAFHITTAIHDSRTSQRMIDYKVREKRFMGTMPEPQVNYLTDNDEIVIAETVAILVKELQLNILAFNVCKDHIHIVLVCEEEELDEIVRKIKGRTAREVNKSNGINPIIISESDKGFQPLVVGGDDIVFGEHDTDNKGLKPLVKEKEEEKVKGEKSVPLWTQKFGRKEIVDDNQLFNTIDYVNTNRVKHNLPENSNKGFQALVDSITCNYEYAFREEYKGGFDVIIGNPPYVPTEFIKENDKIFLEKIYFSAFGRINLFPVFYEKGLILVKESGLLGYITPYTILKNQYYKEARKYILNNAKIVELIDFKGITVFEDAAVDSIIFIIKKEISNEYNFRQISNIKSFENQIYQEDYFNISEIKENDDLSMLISSNDKLIKKVIKNSIELKNIINFNQGIITGGNSKYLTTEKSDLTEKIVTGSDFNRYKLSTTNQLIVYDTKLLHRPRKREIFEASEKILLRQTGSYPICMYDNQQFFTLDTVHNGLLLDNNYSLKFLMTLLNSKFLRFLYESQINEDGKVFAQVKIIYIDPLPIPKTFLENQQPLIEKADLMLSLNKNLQEQSQKFQRTIQRKFELTELSTKLENWYSITYKEFIAELAKKKVKLSLADEAEWEDYFLTESKKVQAIKAEIEQTDKQIDAMVYQLYELTDEEIKIVEGN
jgi:REP element-mobilizing transposase RayT/type I restriction-modification system DNA methylase subunit